MEQNRKPRKHHLIHAIVLIIVQLIVLHTGKWNPIAMYTTAGQPWWFVICMWIQIFAIAFHLITFVTYNHKSKDHGEKLQE